MRVLTGGRASLWKAVVVATMAGGGAPHGIGWGLTGVNKRHRSLQGAPRSRALVPRSGRAQLPQVYLAQTARAAESVYHPDNPEARRGSRLKWMAGTLLAAAVGVLAIGLVLFTSIEVDRPETGILESIKTAVRKSIAPGDLIQLATTSPELTRGKADRLTAAVRGSTTRHIIRESLEQKKGDKTFIVQKPYTRVVAHLSSLAGPLDDSIPPFNPFTLYNNATGAGEPGEPGAAASGTLATALRDPDGGTIPDQDNQQLSDAEALAIVLKSRDGTLDGAPMEDGGGASEAGTDGPEATPRPAAQAQQDLPPNTIVLAKNQLDDVSTPQFEGQQVRAIQSGANDTLTALLQRNGVSAGQARAIVAAAKKVVDGEGLVADQEVRLVLAPAETGAMQPALITVFSEAHSHLVTVARTGQGTYVGSENPLAANFNEQLAELSGSRQHNTLYTGLYEQALQQGMPAPMIVRMVRTFAYDTDFRRRVGPGDGFEAFFDIAEETAVLTGAPAAASSGKPKELLYASLTVGGETRKFYRFRTVDGVVDYYDVQGNNAKKFLTLKPLRGEARYTSGFGYRVHPLLHIKKMHTGIDWAGTVGTPILAAGTGVLEDYGRKGGNGNYARIRHANGYETAYSHMSRFAPGLSVGSKVNQGDLIGYLGNTGLSTGPHLHFEVLVNKSFVDPMSIHVPRDRQLSGRQLTEFQKERTRIDDLMQRQPVMSLVDQVASKG
jgi:murein DD-endopeptidase MepM/ murein hydrolase activator NlpD